MIPTVGQWKARTDSSIEARRGHVSNPELLTIDNDLALYQNQGQWPVSIKPLTDILTTIEQ
jgi:hypothetical protein